MISPIPIPIPISYTYSGVKRKEQRRDATRRDIFDSIKNYAVLITLFTSHSGLSSHYFSHYFYRTKGILINDIALFLTIRLRLDFVSTFVIN